HRSRRDDIPTFLAVTFTPVRMTTASRNIRTRLATSLSVLLVLSTAITGQTNTGEISGMVRDVQGGALPGARVIAEHADSGVRIEHPDDEHRHHHLACSRVGKSPLIRDSTRV